MPPDNFYGMNPNAAAPNWFGLPSDMAGPNNLYAGMQGLSAPSGAGFAYGGSGGGVQPIRPYVPWASGTATGFGGKLGEWVTGNGQMIGNMANLVGGGIQAYTALKGLSQARDYLKMDKKKLAMAVQDYNTQTQDRLTGRWYATEEERQAALASAQLPESKKA